MTSFLLPVILLLSFLSCQSSYSRSTHSTHQGLGPDAFPEGLVSHAAGSLWLGILPDPLTQARVVQGFRYGSLFVVDPLLVIFVEYPVVLGPLWSELFDRVAELVPSEG